MVAIGLVAGLLLVAFPGEARGWGLRTHRWINEAAIDLVPESLGGWLSQNRSRLSDYGVEPDTVLRKRHGSREAVRHFINLDLYGPAPFKELPRGRAAAEELYGRRRVLERGTLPWTILDLHADLVTQMRRGRWSDALQTSGRAGHYVADAFMPLHTTANHDGQKTGNDGIHLRLERYLVNRRLAEYGQAARSISRRVRGPVDSERVFAVLQQSHALVSELLRADRRAKAAGRVGSARYLDALDREAASLLIRRLGEARSFLARVWETAWIAAGSPALPGGSP